MEKLPNELLVAVLEKLDKKDIETCTKVCKSWKDIINRGIGVHRTVGSSCRSTDSDVKFADVKEIGKVGIRTCVLSNIKKVRVPEYLDKYLVKELEIRGPISLPNFEKLVSPLRNLTHLTLRLEAISSFKIENGRLTFPNMKYFKIIGNAFSKALFRGFRTNDIISANLLKIFLETVFPKLYDLHLLHLPSKSTPNIIMESIVVFLVAHRQSLKNFKFIPFHPSTTLQLNVSELSQNTKFMSTDQLQLKNIEIHNKSVPTSGHDRIDHFDQIMRSQKSICRYLDTTWNPVFQADFVRNSSATLVSIEMILKANPNLIIDCEIFADCSALKILSLIGPDEGDGPGTIFNTKYLPNSMKSVRFCGFLISTIDCAAVVTKEWDRLKYLELNNVGTETNFGVPFHAVCQLLANKCIRNVNIKAGINKESMAIANIFDEEAFPPHVVRFVTNDPADVSVLTFHLNKRNSYVNGSNYYPEIEGFSSILRISMNNGRITGVGFQYYFS